MQQMPGMGGMGGMGGMPQAMQNMQQPMMQPGIPGMPQMMQPNMPHQNHPSMQMPPQMQHPVKQPNEKNDAAIITEFVNKLNETPFMIPDPVINNICAQAGLTTSNPEILRIYSLICQTVLMMTINECKKTSENEHLQLSAVKAVLNHNGIPVHRPDYLVNPIESEDTNTDDTQGYDYADRDTWVA